MKLPESNVMLDLETAGTAPGSVILSIGACHFTHSGVQSAFETNIDLASSIVAGFVTDPDTILWWGQQSLEARRAAFTGETPITEALKQFAAWFALLPAKTVVWGNGSTFDNVLLTEAFRKVGLPAPWRHTESLCYRTVKKLFPDIILERTGIHHKAVDDATTQAQHMLSIFNRANAHN